MKGGTRLSGHVKPVSSFDAGFSLSLSRAVSSPHFPIQFSPGISVLMVLLLRTDTIVRSKKKPPGQVPVEAPSSDE
jgi:hypothetical protein